MSSQDTAACCKGLCAFPARHRGQPSLGSLDGLNGRCDRRRLRNIGSGSSCCPIRSACAHHSPHRARPRRPSAVPDTTVQQAVQREQICDGLRFTSTRAPRLTRRHRQDPDALMTEAACRCFLVYADSNVQIWGLPHQSGGMLGQQWRC